MRGLFRLLIIAIGCTLFLDRAGANPAILHNSGHSGTIYAIAVAPNEKWFASASSDSTVKLWDLASGRLLRTLTGHSKKISRVAITPDARQVVTLSEDATVKVWDAESGRLIRTISGLLDKSDFVQESMVVSADGRAIYSNSFGAIRRLDLASGSLLKRYPKQSTFAQWLCFDVSRDDRLIAAAHSVGTGSQVKLIEADSGKLVRVLGTYSGKESATSIAFSPNGRLVAVGGSEGVKVWEVSSSRLLFTLAHSETKNSNYVNQVGFTADSSRIVTAGGPEGIKYWDSRSGDLIRTFKDERFAWSGAFAFTSNRPLMISASGQTISATDLATDKPLTVQFGQGAHTINWTSLTQDQWLEIGPSGLVAWDIRRGQPVQFLEAKPGHIAGTQHFAGVDGDAHVIVATNALDELAVNVWDATAGNLLRKIEWTPKPKGKAPCPDCSAYSLNDVTISPNGRWLAASLWGDDTGSIKIWDVRNGSLAKTLKTGAGTRTSPDTAPTRTENHMVFSPDSRSLIAGPFDSKIRQWIQVWDVDSGRLANSFQLEPLAKVGEANNYKFVLSPDGRTLTTQYSLYGGRVGKLSSDSTIAAIDLATGRPLRTFEVDGVSEPSQIIQYAPDGRLVLTANYASEIISVRDSATGRFLRRLEGNPGTPWSIAYSSDGQRLIVGNSNGTSSIWDARSWQRLAISLHAPSGEWVTITPEGFFTASEQGAELLHVVRGMETTGIDQFYQSLYRPDLVREKLSGDPRGLVREAAANLDLDKVIASGSPPDVRLTLPGRALAQTAIDGTTIVSEAEIVDRGGGIGRVEWRVNGVTVGIDAPAVGSAAPVRLSRILQLDPGPNTILVVAYNSANLTASIPAKLSVTAQVASPSNVPLPGQAPGDETAFPPTPVVTIKPRLFVLAAGVNDYIDQRIKLNYAVPDAKEVVRGFQEASGNLYRSVEAMLMTDKDVTKEKLDAAFAEMASKAAPSDVFVLYLAGHGKTVDGRYYFIPQDLMIEGDLSDKSIGAAVKAKGIAQDQWQRWFASIPARRSLILFDTCDSGTLAGDETQELERTAANDRLAQATGRSILAASGGSQEAIEGYRGHGLFTYQILDAINRSDGDNNGTVELNELAAYVYGQVSEISQKVFKQRQAPQMRITLNYPLTKATRILPDEDIPVAEGKPTVQLAKTASLQVQPGNGATVVRSLDVKTSVTVLETRNGWSLVASEGKPLGYVAAKDLVPAQ